MEPVAFVVDKIKGFAKSGQYFVDRILHRRDKSARRNPIEILKRLQRESFSDLMKLRDRQDKVERMLSFLKASKGSPFQEASTHVKGEVDVLGAILMMGDIDREHYDTLDRTGIKPGITSRFTFETSVREKDSLVAEFFASQKGTRYHDDVHGNALSLAKVSYMADINDWFSAIAVPVGAQFRDLEITRNSSNKRKGATDLSYATPPLLNQHNGSAIGLTVRKSNVTALVAQSVSGLGLQPFSDRIGHCFSTFGQIVSQLPRGIKLSLLGLHQHQVSNSSNQCLNLGALTIPVGFLKYRKTPETMVNASTNEEPPYTREAISTGSMALKLESEFDEYTRIWGWIEMKNSNPKHLQWAVNVSDDSEDEFGWGMSLCGTVEGPSSWRHLQAESYVKLNIGKKFYLRPSVAYAVDGNARILALMLRSNWSF